TQRDGFDVIEGEEGDLEGETGNHGAIRRIGMLGARGHVVFVVLSIQDRCAFGKFSGRIRRDLYKAYRFTAGLLTALFASVLQALHPLLVRQQTHRTTTRVAMVEHDDS